MLHLFEIGQPQGWLLALLRKCARFLLEPSLPPSFPMSLVTSVFALLQKIVSVPQVADMLIEGGILRVLIPLVKSCKHIRLVTRTTRVICELFRRASNAVAFADTGVLDHITRRLHTELEQCEPLCRTSRLGILRAHKVQLAHSILDDIITQIVSSESASTAPAASTSDTSSAPAPTDAMPMEVAGTSDTPPSVAEPLCPQETKSFLKTAFRVLLDAVAESSVATAVRSLVEGHFVASLEMILRNPTYYGGTLWTESVRWIETFCNNEPALLSQLQDAGLMDAFFDSLRKVNYTTDIMYEVIRAISAFCLNARGLAAVIRAEPLFIITGSLLDKRFVSMVGPDAAQKIGSLTEELLRHQPGLLNHGVEAIVRLLQHLIEIGNTSGIVVLTGKLLDCSCGCSYHYARVHFCQVVLAAQNALLTLFCVGLDAELRRRERKWRAEDVARAAAESLSADSSASAAPPDAGAAAAVAAAAAVGEQTGAGQAAATGPAAAAANVGPAAAAPASINAPGVVQPGDGDQPMADALPDAPAEAGAAEGGSPSGSGRASPTSTAATAGSLEIPLYDFVSSTALFLHAIFTDRSPPIIRAFVERDGLQLLVRVLKMPALPQVFSLSSALAFMCATFQGLAMIHTDTYMTLCRELSGAIAGEDVQDHLKPENIFKVYASVPKCLLYLDRLATVGLDLVMPEAEPLNLDWDDIARITESLPRLDVGVLVQLGALSLDTKPTQGDHVLRVCLGTGMCMCMCMCMCMYVCVCVCVSWRERECVCVCV
jgi:hypothetical protein